MAVKLHRCPVRFAKAKGHPCWTISWLGSTRADSPRARAELGESCRRVSAAWGLRQGPTASVPDAAMSARMPRQAQHLTSERRLWSNCSNITYWFNRAYRSELLPSRSRWWGQTETAIEGGRHEEGRCALPSRRPRSRRSVSRPQPPRCRLSSRLRARHARSTTDLRPVLGASDSGRWGRGDRRPELPIGQGRAANRDDRHRDNDDGLSRHAPTRRATDSHDEQHDGDNELRVTPWTPKGSRAAADPLLGLQLL